jgi:Polysaccharide deacetylase
MGLDIDNNPEMQGFLRRMAAAGHEVGSHGGWNHNIFGHGANANNEAQFRPYLEFNHTTMSKTLGTPVRSYSAPMGNQPVWVTHWLEQQGMKAYYFTGDAGLGPTRTYFEGKRPDARVWAFPVTHFRNIATLEELDPSEADQESTPFTKFLEALTDYVATERVSRLIYFHPPAMTSFEPAVKTLIESSTDYQAKGRFRWYTMERLADFLSLRDKAEWTVTGEPGRSQRLLATSTATLKELTWIVPTASVRSVVVLQGVAQLRKQGADWLVTAGDCQTLELELQ